MNNILKSLCSPRVRISVLLTASVLAILFCFINLPILYVGLIELAALAVCIALFRKIDVSQYELFQYKPHWFCLICEWYWTLWFCLYILPKGLKNQIVLSGSTLNKFFMLFESLTGCETCKTSISNVIILSLIILTIPAYFYFFRWLFRHIAEFFQSFTKYEKYLFSISSGALIAILIIVSSKTSYFVCPVDRELYVTENEGGIVLDKRIYEQSHYYCDFFFNTDTASLLRFHYYERPYESSRHPLAYSVFAFSRPLLYLIGAFFSFFFRSQVYCISLSIAIIQIFAFTLTGLLLGRLFLPIINDMYSKLLSIIYLVSFPALFCYCPERLIFSSFFLVVAVYYGMKENKRLISLLLEVSAIGMTSLALAPLALNNFLQKRYWRIALLFFILIFVTLYHNYEVINSNTSFISRNKPKVQFGSYFQFVSSCLIVPSHEIIEIRQQKTQTPSDGSIFEPSLILVLAALSKADALLGLIVVTLCCISSILYMKHRIVLVCSFWILLSFAIIGVIGFGNSECVLYCSYFSWAFIPLALLPFYWLWQKYPRLPIPQALYLFAAYLAISNLYFIYQVVQVVSERYIVPPGM